MRKYNMKEGKTILIVAAVVGTWLLICCCCFMVFALIPTQGNGNTTDATDQKDVAEQNEQNGNNEEMAEESQNEFRITETKITIGEISGSRLLGSYDSVDDDQVDIVVNKILFFYHSDFTRGITITRYVNGSIAFS